MRIDSLILDRTATFTFGRDPFMPPQAWQCTVMIEFEMLPTTGHMRIGSGDVQLVTYTPTPAIPSLEPSARRPDSN